MVLLTNAVSILKLIGSNQANTYLMLHWGCPFGHCMGSTQHHGQSEYWIGLLWALEEAEGTSGQRLSLLPVLSHSFSWLASKFLGMVES